MLLLIRLQATRPARDPGSCVSAERWSLGIPIPRPSQKRIAANTRLPLHSHGTPSVIRAWRQAPGCSVAKTSWSPSSGPLSLCRADGALGMFCFILKENGFPRFKIRPFHIQV